MYLIYIVSLVCDSVAQFPKFYIHLDCIIDYIMGRKWTNISFVFDRDETVIEASSSPRTTEEKLYDYLIEEWDGENIGPVENIDFMLGNPSTETLESYLEKICQECPFIESIGVVYVTDSAHIGYGSVYEWSDNSLNLLETYNGYEGARGEDVSEMIYDEYNISVDPTWYWDYY